MQVTSFAIASANRLGPPMRLELTPAPEISLLRAQLESVQEEMRQLREATIPQMNTEIECLADDLLDTKEKISHFNQSFDILEKKSSSQC